MPHLYRIATAGSSGRGKRNRIDIGNDLAAVYAVGDVHGCYRQLLALEGKIIEDAAKFDGRKLIVMLGDYVDRGPDAASVVEHLSGPPPPGFERICLAGNHEAAMLSFMDGRLSLEGWVAIGGLNTLYAYGVDPQRNAEQGVSRKDFLRVAREAVPAHHVAFMRALPVLAFTDTLVFVHAGLRPGVSLSNQTETDLMTIREDFFAASHAFDRIVIHGHTPAPFPVFADHRLCIDTGAYDSGVLTAVRIAGREAALMSSS